MKNLRLSDGRSRACLLASTLLLAAALPAVR